MKVLSTDGLTKLIELIKGAFISVDDTVSTNSVTLATVATSGSYNDLSDKPTIPATVTESTVSGWGFTKNAGTITGITMNGFSKGTSGVVDLGTVITAHQDISGKVNVSDIASSVSASSTNAVPVGAKLFYDTVGNIETALNTINSGSNS